MSGVDDHAFTVTVDVVKLDYGSDRVVINGYLGETMVATFNGGRLEFRGNEATISILINKNELGSILDNASGASQLTASAVTRFQG